MFSSVILDRPGVSPTASDEAGRLTAVLRRSLRSDHERLERRLSLPASVTDSADYARLLAFWAGIWSAVEVAADATTEAGAELVILAGGACAALSLDRAELGPTPLPPTVPLDVPPDEASQWGVAYVLRGSFLGNRILHPLILRRLDGTHRSAFRFLAGSGPDGRREWTEFCRRLDTWATPRTEPDHRRTVAAAAMTFRFVDTAAEAAGWVTVSAPGAIYGSAS